MSGRARIVSKGGWARGLIPLYSIDQAVFTAALAVLVFALMLVLEPGAASAVTVGGVSGASVVAYSARPAYFFVMRGQSAAVVAELESIAYRFVPEQDYWVPPIPRWQRWTYNFVSIEEQKDSVRVCGPANVLKILAKSL